MNILSAELEKKDISNENSVGFSASIVDLLLPGGGGQGGGDGEPRELHLTASLLDLLPKGGNSMVDSLENEGKYLRRILFLIQEAEEGIQHFLKGNLSHFDPHVGDTACQIRAYYFAFLWQEREVHVPPLEKDRSQLRQYAEKIMILMERSQQGAYRDKRPERLDAFLEDLGMRLKLSELGLVLTISHILSKYRWVDEERISQFLDEDKLIRTIFDTGTFVKELVRHLQRKLSKFSTNFIDEEAIKLEERGFNLYSCHRVLLLLHRWSDFDRSVYPCLATLEVILNSIRWLSKIPIVLMLSFLKEEDQSVFIYQVDQLGSFQRMKLDDFLEDESVVIFRGLTSLSKKRWLNMVEEEGIEKILLSYAADHSQYSGLRLSKINLSDFGKTEGLEGYSDFYSRMHSVSQELHISMTSPCLPKFYVKHICSARVMLLDSLVKDLYWAMTYCTHD
jgi:hypothetical protein